MQTMTLHTKFQFQMVRLKAVDIDDFAPLIFNL